MLIYLQSTISYIHSEKGEKYIEDLISQGEIKSFNNVNYLLIK